MTARLSPADADRLETTILVESIRHRADATQLAVLGMLISIGPFYIVLRDLVPGSALALWIVPIIPFLLARAFLSMRSRTAIAERDQAALMRLDDRFRVLSLGLQSWVGSGMWSVAGRGGDVDLYVTLAVCIFGFGAAGSLGHDARTVMISIPLLFGQAIAFWLLRGAEGYSVSIPLISVMVLIITTAWRAERTFRESIAIRFENDALVRDLEAQRESALAAARVADEANRSKSMFLAAASHDLRQPLYAISLLADTLALQDLSSPTRAVVSQQARALEILRHMFDNLLDLSRFDSGDVATHVDSIYLPDLLTDLDREFAPLFEARKLPLEIRCPDVWVRSDYDLLGRLLRNLVGNALRYTDRGHVAIDVEPTDTAIRLTVSDTGRGIDPVDHERIFQEFVQLDNPARTREKGVGLGLSIVRRIADLLGHTLAVDSTLGEGTRMIVTLEASVEPADRRPSVATSKSGAASPRPDLYLWIVEDDPLVRGALASHLTALSIRHDFAESRAELEALGAREGWPDRAILDDMLGGGETGLDLARWLAQDLPAERILIVTGNTEPERSKQLAQSGFKLLRKPVSAAELDAWLCETDAAEPIALRPTQSMPS